MINNIVYPKKCRSYSYMYLTCQPIIQFQSKCALFFLEQFYLLFLLNKKSIFVYYYWESTTTTTNLSHKSIIAYISYLKYKQYNSRVVSLKN
jgi:hypothetical protein